MKFITKNLLYIVPALLAVITLAYISLIVLPAETSTKRFVPVPGDQIVNNAEANLVFSYPGSETGLILLEPPVPVDGVLKKAYILMPTQEYIVYQGTSTESGGESPRSISLLVFTEPDEVVASGTPKLGRQEKLKKWARENQGYTSYSKAIGEVTTADVDGLEMLRYTTDGLYLQDVYLGAYRGNIFMFIGQYDGNDDPMREQFKEVLDTVRFE